MFKYIFPYYQDGHCWKNVSVIIYYNYTFTHHILIFVLPLFTYYLIFSFLKLIYSCFLLPIILITVIISLNSLITLFSVYLTLCLFNFKGCRHSCGKFMVTFWLLLPAVIFFLNFPVVENYSFLCSTAKIYCVRWFRRFASCPHSMLQWNKWGYFYFCQSVVALLVISSSQRSFSQTFVSISL